MPHDRITAGDAGKIAKASRRIAEDFQVFITLGQGIDQAEGQQVRQVTGRRQHFIVTLHLHVLYIRPQCTPEPVNQRKRVGIGTVERGQDHFVAAKQLGVGSFHPALLGTSNGVAGHEARQLAGERFARRAHHITLGAADISENRLAEIERGQFAQQGFHGQDGHCQLNDRSPFARQRQVRLTAVDYAQLDRQFARLRVQIDADNFTAQATFAQPFGKRTADQAEADHDQTVNDRLRRRHDFNHEPGPCSALRGNAHSRPAGRWSLAGGSACHSWLPGERSRPHAAAPEIPEPLRAPGQRQ
ncbi:hypothetical protein D9M71_255810 [compost metagenome]